MFAKSDAWSGNIKLLFYQIRHVGSSKHNMFFKTNLSEAENTLSFLKSTRREAKKQSCFSKSTCRKLKTQCVFQNQCVGSEKHDVFFKYNVSDSRNTSCFCDPTVGNLLNFIKISRQLGWRRHVVCKLIYCWIAVYVRICVCKAFCDASLFTHYQWDTPSRTSLFVRKAEKERSGRYIHFNR